MFQIGRDFRQMHRTTDQLFIISSSEFDPGIWSVRVDSRVHSIALLTQYKLNEIAKIYYFNLFTLSICSLYILMTILYFKICFFFSSETQLHHHNIFIILFRDSNEFFYIYIRT